MCDAEWAQSAMHSVGSTFGVVRNPYALDKTTGEFSANISFSELFFCLLPNHQTAHE